MFIFIEMLGYEEIDQQPEYEEDHKVGYNPRYAERALYIYN